ncbi:hypothetical protein TRFO_01370 [Tritrichomonas foetus]|uniref:C2H2-type domain-containing protein n=1 Tax=Tritrichomonas foetus TaxID=1144522 RepID=A0A1J4K8B1_9EUKA|nr:hypothetical protein TRFO_01370 [Tritrichomonas foetus]|eukprot:OHT07210.1 hypothetical protein TRFO_01370 [Tritrichomonas foetus]
MDIPTYSESTPDKLSNDAILTEFRDIFSIESPISYETSHTSEQIQLFSDSLSPNLSITPSVQTKLHSLPSFSVDADSQSSDSLLSPPNYFQDRIFNNMEYNIIENPRLSPTDIYLEIQHWAGNFKINRDTGLFLRDCDIDDINYDGLLFLDEKDMGLDSTDEAESDSGAAIIAFNITDSFVSQFDSDLPNDMIFTNDDSCSSGLCSLDITSRLLNISNDATHDDLENSDNQKDISFNVFLPPTNSTSLPPIENCNPSRSIYVTDFNTNDIENSEINNNINNSNSFCKDKQILSIDFTNSSQTVTSKIIEETNDNSNDDIVPVNTTSNNISSVTSSNTPVDDSPEIKNEDIHPTSGTLPIVEFPLDEDDSLNPFPHNRNTSANSALQKIHDEFQQKLQCYDQQNMLMLLLLYQNQQMNESNKCELNQQINHMLSIIDNQNAQIQSMHYMFSQVMEHNLNHLVTQQNHIAHVGCNSVLDHRLTCNKAMDDVSTRLRSEFNDIILNQLNFQNRVIENCFFTLSQTVQTLLNQSQHPISTPHLNNKVNCDSNCMLSYAPQENMLCSCVTNVSNPQVPICSHNEQHSTQTSDGIIVSHNVHGSDDNSFRSNPNSPSGSSEDGSPPNPLPPDDSEPSQEDNQTQLKQKIYSQLSSVNSVEELNSLIHTWIEEDIIDTSLNEDDDLLMGMYKTRNYVFGGKFACPHANCFCSVNTAAKRKTHILEKHDNRNINPQISILNAILETKLVFKCNNIKLIPFFCMERDCGALFEDGESLRNHITNVHRSNSSLTTKFGWFWGQLIGIARSNNYAPGIHNFTAERLLYCCKQNDCFRTSRAAISSHIAQSTRPDHSNARVAGFGSYVIQSNLIVTNEDIDATQEASEIEHRSAPGTDVSDDGERLHDEAICSEEDHNEGTHNVSLRSDSARSSNVTGIAPSFDEDESDVLRTNDAGPDASSRLGDAVQRRNKALRWRMKYKILEESGISTPYLNKAFRSRVKKGLSDLYKNKIIPLLESYFPSNETEDCWFQFEGALFKATHILAKHTLHSIGKPIPC